MSWEAFKDRLMTNPSFQNEWEALDLPYQVVKGLIERRRDLNLSQEELADRLGMKQSSIARIESGRHSLSLATLEKIAKGLDAEVEITIRPRPGTPGS